MTVRVQRTSEFIWEIPRTERADMRVPARVFGDGDMVAAMNKDHSLDQLVNVTTLPGIVSAAVGMPDMHEGYGFPVGGVAATALPDGVISPGGIGFDINCGVRLLASRIMRQDLAPRLTELVHEISRTIPSGFGRGGRWVLSTTEMTRVLEEGCPYLVRQHGLGVPEDLERIESGGALPGADVAQVSLRARSRGQDQLGTLGSGNHFLEVQVVDEIMDPAAGERLGLVPDAVVVLIHTGSRGLGHQVCADHLRVMDELMRREGWATPDRQLAYAPLSSAEGTRYFGAMRAAANFAWCNRQTIGHRVRDVFRRVFGGSAEARLELVYDIAHNIATIENLDGSSVCVHRKGATRSLGPSHEDVPEAFRGLGQPVFIPGSMGTASFVMLGSDAPPELALSSSCHGAGRTLSRGAAKRQVAGHLLRKELEGRGIVVRCPSNAELAEEAPLAYKDIERVVQVVHKTGLARPIARLRPLGVVKG